jgi:hypothetical protein
MFSILQAKSVSISSSLPYEHSMVEPHVKEGREIFLPEYPVGREDNAGISAGQKK